MASVNVYTAEHTDDVFDEDIVSGSVDGAYHLQLQKRSGALVDAGYVRGATGAAGTNGTNAIVPERYVAATSYAVGAVVGYAGRTWKCIQAGSGKCPPFYGAYWTPLNGIDSNEWFQDDPFMVNDTFGRGWETFWQTGSAVASRTTTAGEFETGIGALKITLPASSSQRIYARDDSVVHGGEVITCKVRAKLTAAATGCTVNGVLNTTPKDSAPEPFASGLVQTASMEGAQTLDTTWRTFTFTCVAPNATPRAKFHVTVDKAAGSSAVAVIDRIEVKRGYDTDWWSYAPYWTASVFGNYGSGWAPCYFKRVGDRVFSEGLMSVGGFGWGNGISMNNPGGAATPLPTWARPSRGNHMEVIQTSIGTGRFDVNSDGNMMQQIGTVGAGGWVSLDLEWPAV